MTETERLKQTLERYNLTPSKSLGQNFLIDAGTVERIADAAKIGGRDVLEIGPGLGALTQALLFRAARVVAVEKDARLAAVLPELCASSQLTVRCEDFLRTDVLHVMGGNGFSAVGNLPYYVTTPIAEKLLLLLPESATLMVQSEAAERFFAAPGARVYGPLAALARQYYEIAPVLDVPRSCFYPQPHVDSAIVRLVRKQTLPALPPRTFFAFLNRAFAMRRKTLKNNFPGTPAAEALAALGLPANARAESLTPEQLMRLCERMMG